MNFIRKVAEGGYRAVFGNVVVGSAQLSETHKQNQEQPGSTAKDNKGNTYTEPEKIVASSTDQHMRLEDSQDQSLHEKAERDSRARTLALLNRALQSKLAITSSDSSGRALPADFGSSQGASSPEEDRPQTTFAEQSYSASEAKAATLKAGKKRNRSADIEGVEGGRPSKSRKVNAVHISRHTQLDKSGERGQQDGSALHETGQSINARAVEGDGAAQSKVIPDSGNAQRDDEIRPFTDRSDAELDLGDSPVRLVVVSDQGIPRTALLLNDGFVQKLRDAISSVLSPTHTAEEADRQLANLAAFHKHAEEELARAPARWQALEGVPRQEAEMQRIARESKTLERKLERSRAQERQVRVDLKEAERDERVQCLQAIIAIEDVFLEHGFVGEDNDPTRRQIDLDEDFSIPSSRERVLAHDSQSVQHSELTAKEAAHHAYWARYDELQVAKDNFSKRKHITAQQDDSHSELSAAVHVSDPDRPSDLRHVQNGMVLTRRLIDAEERLATAKTHAVQLGVVIEDSELSSGFVDSDPDGADSDKLMPHDLVDQPRIFKWLEDIPEVMDVNNSARGWIDSLTFARGTTVRPDDVRELDEWDGPAVALKDSTSLVAEGSHRRRIDRAMDRSGINLVEVKRHWGEHNMRGFTSENWDRAHRLFETSR